MNDFDEYLRQEEPDRKKKAAIWQTAIGLQAVDGLKTSDYLKETARKHIEGEINIDEARTLIKTYYLSKSHRETTPDEMQEADKVSANITNILSAQALDFSAKGFIALHRRIFEGVFKHAGQLRDYNITKKEWVLENDTVQYLNWEDLHRALEYDIEQERAFSYQGLSADEIISHITRFVSGIWQIHPFGEGNTRTTAVFTILYLRHIGLRVENDMFAAHSWYFRNALVRANYRNVVEGIDYSPIYLERFFRNLLLGEQWDLRNRYLHIHPNAEWSVQPRLSTPAVPSQNTPQVQPKTPHKLNQKYPTSSVKNTPQVRPQESPLQTKKRERLVRLASVMGNAERTVNEIMEALQLKDRKNFLDTYLKPAMAEGYVQLLYPKSPRHPRQKYLLTPKGLALCKSNVSV